MYARANVIFTFIRKNAPGGVWTLAGICAGVWAGVYTHVCVGGGLKEGIKSCNRVSFEFCKIVARLCDCCKILKQN